MRPTENFRRQHGELLEHLGKLKTMLDPRSLAQDAPEARRLLITLAAKLKIHHSLMDDYLYPRLVNCTDTGVSTAARRCQLELSKFSKTSLQYTLKWKDLGAIEAHPLEFIMESNRFIQELNLRISRENSDLFEQFDKLSPQMALDVLTSI